MHVGVEEAVAQRVAQEALDHLAAEVGQVDLRLGKALVVVQRDAVDPLHRQHVVRGAVPVDGGHAEIRVVARVLRHLRQRGGLQPQIHLHRDRAGHGVDHFDQAQPPRLGRIGLGLVRDVEEIGEIAAEACGHVGPQHLDGDGPADAVAQHLAAMHLRDRSGRDRRAEAREDVRQWPLERGRDRSFRLGLRERRQAVLKAFEVARHDDADDVRTRCQELTELEIGRAHSRERARNPRAVLDAAALNDARQLQGQLSRRRHQARIDRAEHALARKHERGAHQARNVGDGRDHKRQPECSATMPPERDCQPTRAKPASRIMSAKTVGFGNLRIDSTRYW